MMTDNDIIKALECCTDAERKHCYMCPMASSFSCGFNLKKTALDLINRQKAEIERLKEKEKETIEKVKVAMCLISETRDCVLNDIKKAKSEAIKEFAERLKKEFYNRFGVANYTDIDNLVKEMTEGKE